MGKNHEKRVGYGKLLDAWEPPEDAGEPVGCVATSFTFSPVFFEEECLSRFLQLETDAKEDGPLYLVEREEKLSQLVCAAALVDQHQCKGSRNLRWDLLSARPSGGLFHAKISLLHWSQLIRLIIASANLTEDGYRRNHEIYGILDYKSGSGVPLSILRDIVGFLREGSQLNRLADDSSKGALKRWNDLLDHSLQMSREWGTSDEDHARKKNRVYPILIGPNRQNAMEQLERIWPATSPPIRAYVMSPFFDPPGPANSPAQFLWKLLRKRGKAEAHFYVPAEEVPGEDCLFVRAPESLYGAQPARSEASTHFYRLKLEASRPLHAKGIWLEDERWAIYMIGSSNFTTPGLNLGQSINMEANLAYLVDGDRDNKAYKTLCASFLEGEEIDPDNIKWEPLGDDDLDSAGQDLILPESFGLAIYDRDEKQNESISFTFVGMPPEGWIILTEEKGGFFSEKDWKIRGCPSIVSLPWVSNRPPSGFWVRWNAAIGEAWWPVNVASSKSLPPTQELKDLPLEVLINILTSARPLQQAMRHFLQRDHSQGDNGEGKIPVSEMDPLRRVDSTSFLLQRTRRVSWALNALRERLERPAATVESLQWRLFGPVGVIAFANAMTREAKAEEEKAFLLAELALELWRAKPCEAKGCLPAEQVKKELKSVIKDLKNRIPEEPLSRVENLRAYVNHLFEIVLGEP